MANTSAQQLKNAGLFPPEEEVARRLSQDPRTWRSKVIVLEREGFPPVDAIMGGRFWPAVVAFWQRRYGLYNAGAPVMDGVENLDALR